MCRAGAGNAEARKHVDRSDASDDNSLVLAHLTDVPQWGSALLQQRSRVPACVKSVEPVKVGVGQVWK